jgi:hypothetical protein
MRLSQGDMWSVFEQADLFLVTTNHVVTRDDKLVMGAGIARQALDRFPDLDKALGKAVLAAGTPYGLLVSPRWPEAKLGAFQTKGEWKAGASPALINFSTHMLLEWCEEHPTAQVHLNMPGVGLGGLPLEVVLPILEPLLDTVNVWEYARP